MKIENMKAVVEFIRFKYYFKKEINNERDSIRKWIQSVGNKNTNWIRKDT